MTQTNIAFIGGGNMARALITGLLAKQWPGDAIIVSDPSAEALTTFTLLNSAIETTSDNRIAVAQADVIVLAIKPQAMKSVAQALNPLLTQTRPLIISIAAGLMERDINRWLGGDLPMVRCMPNTPAMVSQGATGLYANDRVTKDQKSLAEALLQAVGTCVWVEDEGQLDAVTALSGSGPAYHFLVMEAMENAGVALGLPADVARQLSLQTALGAATLATHSDYPVAELRRQVTSPGGTTEQAIHTLEEGQLRELF
ncbi:unnamed protein product, partial [Cyprideis torosa]